MGDADDAHDGPPVDLAAVVGGNARRQRLHAGLTLDQVSRAARMRGLNWSESRVADFERGKVAPNLGTLFAVCVALADAGCGGAGLPDLLLSTQSIRINDSLVLSSGQLLVLLRGWPAGRLAGTDVPEVTAIANEATKAAIDVLLRAELSKIGGATEKRLSRSLDIGDLELAQLSWELWGRRFSEERDDRAGDGANAQKRGQITRQMRVELENAMEAAHRGDNQ